ncbi:hypothetical protein SSX86_015445 [Deinandra increscens subsp. villosa]|uniref:Uncharacterized protein n=1 Tax=Deinandra increscens subsp. villosa TaxID=3103831 RepID=A0AAP0GWM2_9ASTR
MGRTRERAWRNTGTDAPKRKQNETQKSVYKGKKKECAWRNTDAPKKNPNQTQKGGYNMGKTREPARRNMDTQKKKPQQTQKVRVLTEPGLSVIVSAVLTSRAIFQRMKNYTIYAVSITIRIVLGFMLLALIWRFDFSPFMVLIIAILNDGTIMTISKDKVKPSPLPDSWKLKEIFATGIVLGTYMAVTTVIFFWLAKDSDFFTEKFGVKPINDSEYELMSALYLQVSIISQALIFVTRSRNWSFVERPGLLLLTAFFIAQLTAFTSKKDYGRGEREAQWASYQRTLHGLQAPNSNDILSDKTDYRELSELAEQAKRRAEVARELHTLKGHVESVVKLKGLDIETIQQHYTV